MKIAIDISPLESGHKVRGVGFYVKMLSENIQKYAPQHEYIFFSGKLQKDVDIVHYPYFDPFFVSLPFLNKYPTIVTVHDLTPIRFPKAFPAGIKGKLRWKINQQILKRADYFITDSEASKNDIHELCSISQSKIDIVYLAAQDYKQLKISELEKKELVKKYNLPESFFLYVGDATWNKNLPKILGAVQQADQHLVMVGKALSYAIVDASNPWNKDLVHAQHVAHEDNRFHILGFIPNDDLNKLYAIATALVMPSLYEGFGLPVLEAMQSGCPVITSKEGSLPEVAGDAALYVDAYDGESIGNALKTLSGNNELQKSLSEKGLTQAKKFSIEKMIADTVAIYEKVHR